MASSSWKICWLVIIVLVLGYLDPPELMLLWSQFNHILNSPIWRCDKIHSIFFFPSGSGHYNWLKQWIGSFQTKFQHSDCWQQRQLCQCHHCHLLLKHLLLNQIDLCPIPQYKFSWVSKTPHLELTGRWMIWTFLFNSFAIFVNYHRNKVFYFFMPHSWKICHWQWQRSITCYRGWWNRPVPQGYLLWQVDLDIVILVVNFDGDWCWKMKKISPDRKMKNIIIWTMKSWGKNAIPKQTRRSFSQKNVNIQKRNWIFFK